MVIVGVAVMSTTLLADIGGSKSRFALGNPSGALERVVLIHNDTVAGLDAAVAHYLEETGARPRAATLAVAGPVDGEEVVLTNRTSWRLRRGEFAKRFGFLQLRVLNDFEAIAWALPHLGAAHTRPLGNPVAVREGVKIVLGPGTGLGVAALLPAGGRWHVGAGRGGRGAVGGGAAVRGCVRGAPAIHGLAEDDSDPAHHLRGARAHRLRGSCERAC